MQQSEANSADNDQHGILAASFVAATAATALLPQPSACIRIRILTLGRYDDALDVPPTPQYRREFGGQMGCDPPVVRPEGVLLVDDDVRALRMYDRCLKRLGIVAFVTGSLAEAETAVRLHRPDLVLVDLYLTEEIEEQASLQKSIRFATRWGIDVIASLRAIDQHVTILLWSAHMSRAYADEALIAGADGTADKVDGVAAVLDSLARGAVPQAPNYERTLTLEQNEWEHVTKTFVQNNRSVSGTARDLATSRTRVLRKLWARAPAVSLLRSHDATNESRTQKSP